MIIIQNTSCVVNPHIAINLWWIWFLCVYIYIHTLHVVYVPYLCYYIYVLLIYDMLLIYIYMWLMYLTHMCYLYMLPLSLYIYIHLLWICTCIYTFKICIHIYIYIIIHLNILLTPNMMRQHFVPKIASGCKQMGVSEYVLYFPEQNRMSLCGSELWYRDPFRVACMVDRSYWTFYYSFDWCFGDHVHLSSLEVWNQLITMESAALVASAGFLLASWALR